jgi:multidrug efflux pump subunit AcrB
LVLAITFVVMAYAGISLQRISLGALIHRARSSGR